MSKRTKWILGIAALLVLIVLLGPNLLLRYTKQFSPEKTVTYQQNGYDLRVTYSSPSKKGRVIFGDIVPYNQVWRTGANEPTMFSTNKDLQLEGKTLPAGEYSIWTIPGQNSWQVMFNNGSYSWGVDFDAKPQYDKAFDVLVTQTDKVPVQNTEEHFNFSFEEATNGVNMYMTWEDEKVKLTFVQ